MKSMFRSRLFIRNSFSARFDAMTSFLPTCPANEVRTNETRFLCVCLENGTSIIANGLDSQTIHHFENSSFNYHIQVIGLESLKRSLRIS